MGKKIGKYFRKKYSQQYQEYSQCLFSTSSFIQKTKTNETKKQNKNLLNVNNTICKQEKYFFSPKNNFPSNIIRFKIKIFKKILLFLSKNININNNNDNKGLRRNLFYFIFIYFSYLHLQTTIQNYTHTHNELFLSFFFVVVFGLRMFNKQQRFCSSLIQPNK